MVEEQNFNELPTQTARDILQDVIKYEFRLTNPTIEICAGSAKGDNYLGIIYRIRVTEGSAEHYVIAKLPPTNEARREQFNCRASFIREISFYDDYLPLLINLQREKGINIERDGFYEVAKVYKTSLVDPEEGIFFEDLRALGFQMFNRQKEITIDHVEPVMRALGKYHALGFAIKQQKAFKIAKFMDMVDFFFLRQMDPDPMEGYIKMQTDRAFAILDPVKDADIIPRIKAFFSKSFKEAMEECLDKDTAEPYAVVCHGDCWNNNIMYKYENGKFQGDIRLLDWQIIRYASPVLDLVYYLFGSTNKTVREQMPHLLRTYHKELSIMLLRLDCDPETTFPFSALEKHLQLFGKFGLMMATMCFPIFTINAEDIPDLEEAAEQMKKGDVEGMKDAFSAKATEDIYKSKMYDVIRDICRLGYL